MSAGFQLDLRRCTGCQACVVACRMENRASQRQPWRKVHTYNAIRHPDLPVFHLSLACHHCAHPACLAQCPAQAYTQDPATGAVIIHPERCMGCRYCTWACPYDAPKFDAVRGVIEKCTFCHDRLEKGQEPACVARCPVEALGLDAVRPAACAMDMPGMPASELEPGLRIRALQKNTPPELGVLPEPSSLKAFLAPLLAMPEGKITLRGEWALVVFTTSLAFLVAWQTSSAWRGVPVATGWFLGLGGGAMALSAVHLGHPERAWRAIRNLRSSWLSREIALVSLFLGLGALHGILFPGSKLLGLAAAGTGLLALFAVDRIYRVALKTHPWNLHSAHVLLNALYLAGWMVPFLPLALGAGILKLGLYLARKHHFRKAGKSTHPLWSCLRVVTGFVAPFLVPTLAVPLAILGDLVDRCEYYEELDISTPENHMVMEIRDRLSIR